MFGGDIRYAARKWTANRLWQLLLSETHSENSSGTRRSGSPRTGCANGSRQAAPSTARTASCCKHPRQAVPGKPTDAQPVVRQAIRTATASVSPSAATQVRFAFNPPDQPASHSIRRLNRQKSSPCSSWAKASFASDQPGGFHRVRHIIRQDRTLRIKARKARAPHYICARTEYAAHIYRPRVQSRGHRHPAQDELPFQSQPQPRISTGFHAHLFRFAQDRFDPHDGI